MRKKVGIHAHHSICKPSKALSLIARCMTWDLLGTRSHGIEGELERLDRGLVNDAWKTLFHNVALEDMEHNYSNHRPMWANIEYYNQPEAPNNGQ